MEKNVGRYDRIARAILGPVLILVAVAAFAGLLSLGAGTVGTVVAAVVLLVGAILSVTAVTRKCLIYDLLGVDTLGGSEATETGSKPRAQ